MPGYSPHVLGLVARVRARWRRLIVLRGTMRAALAASAILAFALAVASLGSHSPLLLAVVGVSAAVLVVVAVVWALWPARQSPSNARIARFIEEAEPSLDDRLVSAVDLLDSGADDSDRASALAAPMLADANLRASAVRPDSVVSGDLLRRAGLKAVLAVLFVLAVAYAGRDAARQSANALSFTLFPSRTALEVVPGSIRIQVRAPLRIEARLVGSDVPVDPHVLRTEEPGEHGDWTSTVMTETGPGAYALNLDAVDRAFFYRVVAGGLISETYEVKVARPPQVSRIDVEYSYPPELGIEPHVEEDSGDIFAPAGTTVRLRVRADGDGVTGRLRFEEGETVGLEPSGDVLVAGFTVERDSSYRVTLADVGGLTSAGDTEYFIRVLDDRPPRVRVLRPARDREVTRLEEVEVEAEAVDDFGVDRFELVYSVAGGEEHVLPFDVRRDTASVTGERILYLEDLDVQVGDFLSYYVRARDRARGRQSVEARSDIFFLQVKPFEQDFTLAQSQATGGGSPNKSLDELIDAQKQIIVATWQLDRRAQASGGSQSEEDIQAVARAEEELKTRVERTSSSMRASTMRDPTRRPRSGDPPVPAPGGGQTTDEEHALTNAASAMGQAVIALEDLQTRAAVTPEMTALTHLLRARGAVTERQVMRPQPGGGAGSGRSAEDLSGLFDRQLQQLQQTNYETPATAETRNEADESDLDQVRELARRQDELLREQRELERDRDRLSEKALERELERLTREQAELREQAEALAQRMSRQQSSAQASQSSGSSSGDAGRQAGRQLRAASEEMRGAVSELTRQASGQALARGSNALDQLRRIARQLENSTPDGQRRALGDMQLEARQIGEAERQIGAELGRLGDGEAAQDSMRHLAGNQERLAERVRRLQDALEGQASGQEAGDGGDEQARLQRAARDAADDFARHRLDARMRDSAEAMRRASERGNGGGGASAGGRPDGPDGTDRAGDGRPLSVQDLTSLRQDAEDAGRTLERLADALAAARADSEQSRRLADQLAQTRQLRETMDSLSRQLERLDQDSRRSAGSQGGQAAPSQGSASGPGSGAGEAARLQEEYSRRLRETRELVEHVGREDPGLNAGGAGFTPEDQAMVLSAPGTEAFKQDFAAWEELRRQATEALTRAESSLSRRLNAEASRDRLASGIEDAAPPEYQRQVDDYFKALAGRGRR